MPAARREALRPSTNLASRNGESADPPVNERISAIAFAAIVKPNYTHAALWVRRLIGVDKFSDGESVMQNLRQELLRAF